MGGKNVLKALQKIFIIISIFFLVCVNNLLLLSKSFYFFEIVFCLVYTRPREPEKFDFLRIMIS